jgi:hypothetical protein
MVCDLTQNSEMQCATGIKGMKGIKADSKRLRLGGKWEQSGRKGSGYPVGTDSTYHRLRLKSFVLCFNPNIPDFAPKLSPLFSAFLPYIPFIPFWTCIRSKL